MAETRSGEATQLLRRLARGDEAAAAELLPLVYAELHRLARFHLRKQRRGTTLETSLLVHEAWLKLVGSGEPGRDPLECADRAHFLRVAAHAMRQFLVDHARRRLAQKRGGEKRAGGTDELDGLLAAFEQPGLDLLDLHEALERLAGHDQELERVVELRFFAGLTMAETGEALGLTERQVKTRWDTARTWLYHKISRGARDGP